MTPLKLKNIYIEINTKIDFRNKTKKILFSDRIM